MVFPASPNRLACTYRRAGRRRSAAFAAALALAVPGAALAAEPVFIPQGTIIAPVGVYVHKYAETVFENPGTNARFTEAQFSTEDYYDDHLIVDGVLRVRAKSSEDLRALPELPYNPFYVDVTVTMENDEGETATGEMTFRTTYDDRGLAPRRPPIPAHPELNAPAGILVSATVENAFDNAGTNPRFTGATFSTLDYYISADSGLRSGRVYARAKTADQLNALPEPPSNPFTVTATVTMENDNGHTATGTVEFKTSYEKEEPVADPPPSPTPLHPELNASVGILVGVGMEDAFDNAGTNPRFTGATFSNMEWCNAADTGFTSSRVYARTKTADQLNALSEPPPNPFTVTATVTMENDDGHTVTGTVVFKTSYARNE